MNKKNWIISAIGIALLVYLLYNNGYLAKLGLFSIGLHSGLHDFVQYTSRPVCGSSWCDFAKTTLTYSPDVVINTGINTFKFHSTVDSIEKRQECLPQPNLCSGNTRYINVVNTYIDSDGCQHWSYDSHTISKFESSYGGSCTSTTNVAGWHFWYDNGCQFGPVTPGVQPRVCLWSDQHYSDYGGMIISTSDSSGNVYRGCYQEIQVYKNNNLIDTVYSNRGARTKYYYDDYSNSSGVVLNEGTTSYYSDPTCSAYQNDYDLFISNDSYIITIGTPKTSYIQGEDIHININVKNNLAVMSYGTLKISYQVPTIIGTATKIDEQNVTILPGDNTYQYTLPTTEPVRTINVKPVLNIRYPTSYMSGLNYNFEIGMLYPINYFNNFFLGSIDGESTDIQIVPQPVYINQTITCNTNHCPINYDCESTSGLCIRHDIVTNNVTCLQIGCPQIQGHDYYCTSSGICAETISILKSCKNDSMCPESTSCDVSSGLCIKSELLSIISQCTSDENCAIPCPGITAKCFDKICSYEGSCDKIQYGCKQAGCPEGYICDASNNVCKSKNTDYSTIYYIIGIIASIIGIYSFIKKKK